MQENPNSFVMLDSLPTLIKHNNFRKIQYLIKRLNILIKKHSGVLIAPYGDLKISKKERLVLGTEFTYKTAKGRLASLTGSMIDLYKQSAGKEKFIILGYNTVTKSLLEEFIARKTPCTLVSPKEIQIPYPKFVKIIKKDPLIKEVMTSLNIDASNVNILITYASDAHSILAVNLIRHLTQKAKVLVEVNREKYVDIARKAGANEVVASSAIGGKLLAMSLSHPSVVEWFMDSLTPTNKNLEVQELSISSKSPLIGKSILQADKIFHNSMNILSVSKQGKYDLTHTDDYKIQVGDTIIVIVHKIRLNKDKKLMKFFRV
jgi:voltage-gated potassium channel